MKTLLLIRHAKSSWTSDVLNDFDRPLNDRGKKEAPEMAAKLRKNNIKIDCFVSSPAKRAKKTAKLFVKEFGEDESEIVFIPELYHASASTFSKVIAEIKDEYETVAIFSHNPGITEFANMLVDVGLDNMPTSAVFAVKSSVDHWRDFADSKKELWFFTYPKL